MIIRVSFKETNSVLPIAFTPQCTTITANFGEILKVGNAADLPIYDGDYFVTPAATAQTLRTAQKKMIEDMVIKAIPYAEVTNTSNGKTVTIG